MLTCHLCSLFFTNEASKICHFKQKHTTKLSCSYQNCMAKFYKQTSLDNHKKLPTIDLAQLKMCNNCEYRFRFYMLLCSHANCTNCMKTFERKTEKKIHETTCIGNTVLSCTVDPDSEFKTKNIKYLNEHIRVTHSKCKLYKCSGCDEHFHHHQS